MNITNKSTVELIDFMGTDLTVVNAARVSFDKESNWELDKIKAINFLSDKDTKLINYLGRHNHWSPFAHTSIQIRVSAPIFVARQLGKHQVGLVWNEISRRYVDEEPIFYFPEVWRKRAENKKQGSSDEEYYTGLISETYNELSILVALYNKLILTGCSPEQARMILPQNMMTSWYWTGSLMAFHRVYKQRTDDHAQLETQEVAKQIGEICEQLFPVSWKALTET